MAFLEPFLLSEMTWYEVNQALKETDIAILPTGSIEQHGLHMPLNNDTYSAHEICVLVAKKMAGMKRVIVCPAIPFGLSRHHMPFPGTITLQTQTYINLVKDVCESLIQHGFRKILIFNSHGGNTSALQAVITDLRIDTDALLYVANWWNLGAATITKVCGKPVYHSEESETSLALALNQRVEMDRAKDEIPETESAFIKYDVCSVMEISHASPNFDTLTKSGTIGYATKATKEKGQAFLDDVVNKMCLFIEDIKDI